MRLWERICETLGDSQDLGEHLQDFWGGFMRIHKTLEEDSQGFTRLRERTCETLGEDLQGFTRLWERTCKDL